MAVNPITRNDIGNAPEQVVKEIMQGAIEKSAVLSAGKRLQNMTSKQMSINVLDAMPVAYFVDGDAGQKQTTKQAWEGKKLYAEEIAVIVPIPDAVVDDASFDIWAEVKPRITEAFGRVIDGAILFGTNKPSTWRDSIYTTAQTAGSVVTATSDLYTDIMGVGGVIAKVEESGYMPNRALGAVSLRSKLRGIVDKNGQPIFKADMQGSTQYALDGVPVDFPMNGAFDASKALLIEGDFTQLVYSIRQDITFDVFKEGVIQNPDGTIAYNLMQNDMHALRAVMRLGWEIPNPVNAVDATATRCPFAVLEP